MALQELDYFITELGADDTWLLPTTRSVAIEYLVHLSRGGQRSNFRPRTRRPGRPSLSPADQLANMRPHHVEKEKKKLAERSKRVAARFDEMHREIDDREASEMEPNERNLEAKVILEILDLQVKQEKNPTQERAKEIRLLIAKLGEEGRSRLAKFGTKEGMFEEEEEKPDDLDSEPEGS